VTPIWVTFLAAVISGLFTFLVSTWFYMRHERRKEKLSILKEIMGNRHGISANGDAAAKARFFQALNTTYAVFHDSQPVIQALGDFKIHSNRAGDNVTQLIRRMSHDLGIDTSYLADEFFNEPFGPRSQ
jgi:hypothetical protein